MVRRWRAVLALLGMLVGAVLLLSPRCTSFGRLEAASAEAGAASMRTRQRLLWPVVNDKATLRVCWLPLELGERTFPVVALAPKLQEVMRERKRWVREIVEAEWNGRTPMRFVGFDECGSGPSDVRLRPISSAVHPAGCAATSPGQSCVEAFGRDLAKPDRAVNLNLLFGDEVLYSSRYAQSVSAQEYESAHDLSAWWVPASCLEEFKSPWTRARWADAPRSQIDNPAVLREFMDLYKRCLQLNVLHEFGHVVGFQHEAYADSAGDPAMCARAAAKARKADAQSSAELLESRELDSVMSYCRRDPRPRLTDRDVAMTRRVYLSDAE